MCFDYFRHKNVKNKEQEKRLTFFL